MSRFGRRRAAERASESKAGRIKELERERDVWKTVLFHREQPRKT